MKETRRELEFVFVFGCELIYGINIRIIEVFLNCIIEIRDLG